MASEIDICNLALSRLGDDATVSSIDPPEGSAQAEHCARFYPIARDTLLEMTPAWGFALRRARLACLDVETWTWKFAYAAPADMIRAIAILPPDAGTDAQTQPYEIEGSAPKIILTNEAQATLRYVAKARDTANFPPLFVDALAWLLASYLAGATIKGDKGAQMAKVCMQSFLLAHSYAATSDANQRKTDLRHEPRSLTGR
jgi:hypothetical protein